MATQIKNITTEALALPDPYQGMLPAGQSAVVGDSPTGAVAALGGSSFVTRLLSFVQVPSGAALTQHGAINLDETLTTTAPACSIITQTTRFDLLTAGNNIAATLANGRYLGQRKRFYVMSALTNKTATITPSTAAESRTSIALNTKDAWCELEFQSAGWKVVAGGGPTAAAYTLTPS